MFCAAGPDHGSESPARVANPPDGRIAQAGGRGFLLQADVRNLAEIGAMFAALDRQLAERSASRCNILVNNAGIGVSGERIRAGGGMHL